MLLADMCVHRLFLVDDSRACHTPKEEVSKNELDTWTEQQTVGKGRFVVDLPEPSRVVLVLRQHAAGAL